MDERFEDYFRREVKANEYPFYLRGVRSRRFTRRPLPPDDYAAIADDTGRQALEVARGEAERLGLTLRPDAELLILFLARDLVAAPVAAVTPQEAGELPSVVSGDVARVVSRCAERGDGREISAHSIVDGLSASWDQLRSGGFRVWDSAGDDEAPGESAGADMEQ
jgi:hypothetical protein